MSRFSVLFSSNIENDYEVTFSLSFCSRGLKALNERFGLQRKRAIYAGVEAFLSLLEGEGSSRATGLFPS